MEHLLCSIAYPYEYYYKRILFKYMTKGIWHYHKFLKPFVKELFRLSMGEGNTPCVNCEKLAKFLNLEKVYLKREDLNPTGSFKDRSLAFQLSAKLQEGKSKFVISSTGNAAISAISYCKLFKSEIDVFVSKSIQADKLVRLLDILNIKNFNHNLLQGDNSTLIRKGNITIHFSIKPKSESIKFSQKTNSIHLRGSNDDLATIGYQTISFELLNQARDADSIFIPCSSGTSTIGLYQGYFIQGFKSPSIYIIQTTKVHPIASYFDKNFLKSEESLASAISDKVAKRKDQVIQVISNTGGSGFVSSNEDIMASQMLFKKYCGIEISFDSSLTLSGLIKSIKEGYNLKRPVLIISGK